MPSPGRDAMRRCERRGEHRDGAATPRQRPDIVDALGVRDLADLLKPISASPLASSVETVPPDGMSLGLGLHGIGDAEPLEQFPR